MVAEDLFDGLDVVSEFYSEFGSDFSIACEEAFEGFLERGEVEVSGSLLFLLVLVESLLLQLGKSCTLLLVLLFTSQSFLLRQSHLVILLLLAPVREVTIALQILLGQSEYLERLNHELLLRLDVASQLVVVSGVLQEVVTWLG